MKNGEPSSRDAAARAAMSRGVAAEESATEELTTEELISEEPMTDEPAPIEIPEGLPVNRFQPIKVAPELVLEWMKRSPGAANAESAPPAESAPKNESGPSEAPARVNADTPEASLSASPWAIAPTTATTIDRSALPSAYAPRRESSEGRPRAVTAKESPAKEADGRVHASWLIVIGLASVLLLTFGIAVGVWIGSDRGARESVVPPPAVPKQPERALAPAPPIPATSPSPASPSTVIAPVETTPPPAPPLVTTSVSPRGAAPPPVQQAPQPQSPASVIAPSTAPARERPTSKPAPVPKGGTPVF